MVELLRGALDRELIEHLHPRVVEDRPTLGRRALEDLFRLPRVDNGAIDVGNRSVAMNLMDQALHPTRLLGVREDDPIAVVEVLDHRGRAPGLARALQVDPDRAGDRRAYAEVIHSFISRSVFVLTTRYWLART